MSEAVSHRADDAGIDQHPGLDAIGADVVEHGVDLPADKARLDAHDAEDAARVLRGERGDRRGRIPAQRRHRLDIGLDTRAAARIGSSDDEHPSPHSAARPSAPPAAITASAMSSMIAATSASSSPSAMMRMRGSVPDLRTSKRPVLPSRLSPSLIAAFTDAVSSGAPPANRTFFRSCGTGLKTVQTWLAGAPVSTIAASTCSATINPSPVVA